MFSKRAFLALVAGAGAVPLVARPALAQAYPSRNIRVVVPGSPGGPTDVMARLIGQRLQTALGASVIIENQAGGGGSVAATTVARAEPDGHTLLFCNTSVMATIPAVSKRPTYDPVKDFAPVAKVSQSEQLLVLHPAVPPNSVREFIAYCKANPGKVNCAATGFGGLPHLVAEMFKAMAGVDFQIVPYKGGGDSLTATLGHQVDITFETTTILLPHIREGRLKGLASPASSAIRRRRRFRPWSRPACRATSHRASTAWSRPRERRRP
jgi:tripartite-type tricarboxylate transporter receptor subunit TctC